MRPGRTVLTALVTGLCLAVGSCGQPQDSPETASSTDDPAGPGISTGEAHRLDATARWADRYCGAVAGVFERISTGPAVNPTTAEQAAQTSSELLGTLITGVDDAVRNLQRLGPSPVPAGEDVKAAAVAQFSGIRERAGAAKQELDAAPGDLAASRHAIDAARGPLSEVSQIDLLDGLNSGPELAAATQRAPTCQQLSAHATPSPDSRGVPSE